MAEREFIKIYNVDPKRINSRGELDPDAGLYPAFMHNYSYADTSEEDLPERFGRPIEYDNATNRPPQDVVRTYNKSRAYRDVKRDDEWSARRGFSALAYEGPDKRPSGKKSDTFDDWQFVEPTEREDDGTLTPRMSLTRALDPNDVHYDLVRQG